VARVDVLGELAQPSPALPVRDARGTDTDAGERSIVEREHYYLMGAMPRHRKGGPKVSGCGSLPS
jgi:hypothetical protein